MATVTISTSQDFDSAARTGGDTYDVTTDATLTINTDVRWHKNAPSGANWGTGSLGSLTLTSPGACVVDARNVRWLPYDTGSGNVPALGTSITQGTVTGELLGVYATLGSAPTAAGSAVPVSGFIKFKTVTGGAFAAGALTGIGASANGADVLGWIEIVMDEAGAVNIARPNIFQTRGGWFYLDNTTGSANQSIQLPNPGGSGTYYPGVWIETAPSSDVFEFYPAIEGTTNFSTSHQGTDERSKFVSCRASGIIVIGNNGSGNVGYVPASGCRVRIPNILLNNCTTAARAANTVPHATLATRPEYTTSSSGLLDCEYTIGSWYMNIIQPQTVIMRHCAFFDQHKISEAITEPLVFDDTHNGNYLHSTAEPLYLTFCNDPVMTDCKFGRTGTIGSGQYNVVFQAVSGGMFTRCHFQMRTFRTAIPAGAVRVYNSTNCTFNACVAVGDRFDVPSSINITFNDCLYADSFHLTSSATNTGNAVFNLTAGTSGVLIDGFSWWSSVANVHHDNALVFFNSCSDIRVQNIGTRASPLNAGTSNAMLYGLYDSGYTNDVAIKRVFFVNLATRLIQSNNSTVGYVLENVAGDYALASGSSSANGVLANACVLKNIAMASLQTGFEASCDTIFYHIFTSTSAGALGLCFNESLLYADYLSETLTGASYWSGMGRLYLVNANDSVTWTYPYRIIGVDSFPATEPTAAGSQDTNFNIYYAIRTAAGGDYSEFKNLRYCRAGGGGSNGSTTVTMTSTTGVSSGDYVYGTNIGVGAKVVSVDSGTNITVSVVNSGTVSGVLRFNQIPNETVDETSGFNLKIKIECNTSSTANYLNSFYIPTAANTAAQDIQYPLDTYELQLTQLESGTKVAFLATGTETLLADVQTVGSSGIALYEFDDAQVGDEIDVAILKAGYQYQRQTITLVADDMSVPIFQESDLAYTTATTMVTFDAANKRIICDEDETEIDIQTGIYSAWVDWALTSSNLQYSAALRSVGGDSISATRELGMTYFLLNLWRIRPAEDDYTLTILGNIYTDPAGQSPTVPTLGDYQVTVVMSVSNLTDASITALPELGYSGCTYIDTEDGVDGAAYPSGTANYPVKTLSAAVAIAGLYNLRTYYFRGDLTLDQSFENVTFACWNTLQFGSIALNNQALSGVTFLNSKIVGQLNAAQDGDGFSLVEFKQCYLNGMSDLAGTAIACQIEGATTVKSGGWLSSIGTIIEGDHTVFDLQNSDATVSMDVESGWAQFKNAAAGSLIELNVKGGEVTLESSCVGGEYYIEGVGTLYNDSAMTCKENHLIWDDQLSYHTVEGSTGKQLGELTPSAVAAAVWDYALDGAFTAAEIARILAAVHAGKSTITPDGGGKDVVFRGISDDKDRVTATVDGTSQRTAITVDGAE